MLLPSLPRGSNTGGPRPYGYAGLGELFVFVFFGLVAVVGTTFVLTMRIQWLAVDFAVPVGLFACALLVINNLRDIPGDTAVGKNTLAVRLGDAAHACCTACACGCRSPWWGAVGIAGLGSVRCCPIGALLAVVAVPVALVPWRKVRA